MRKAFTLIELLVVISIIALLIAILLPVLSNANYSAQLTKCAVAIRSIGAVQLSYAVDNKGFYPEAGERWAGGLDWSTARFSGARPRSWELQGTLNYRDLGLPNKPYDLRPIYRDYMQNNDQDAVMHCPFINDKFRNNAIADDRILSYMLYATNNYRTKHFYFNDPGANEKMDSVWSPINKPDDDFTLLASDFAWGSIFFGVGKFVTVPAATVSHPAPNGAIYEHVSQANDVGGYVVDASQSAPVNFADADGSVQTFKVSANSVNDPDNWIVNTPHQSSQKGLLPRDLAK